MYLHGKADLGARAFVAPPAWCGEAERAGAGAGNDGPVEPFDGRLVRGSDRGTSVGTPVTFTASFPQPLAHPPRIFLDTEHERV